MTDKCHQCGEEIEQTRAPGRRTFFEVCFKCGYVRKITWSQMDINDDLGKILDIVEDELASDEQKVISIGAVLNE